MKPRVLLAMSGGVDSSVAAYLLQQQGFDVIGITLKMWSYQKTYFGVNGSHSDNDFIEDAMYLAEKLKIKHYVLDVQNNFQNTIIQNFIDEYFKARTPNPCVICNPNVKWHSIIKKADELNCQWVATGHYVNLLHNNNRFFLGKGKDVQKDQSYVLWNMPQNYLSRSIFPLGNYLKSEIKDIANQLGIHKISEKRESYDVCFIPDGDYRAFLKLHCANKCDNLCGGTIFDTNGKVLGKHKGFPFYTIGQRKGLEVAVGHPIFVTRLDPLNNTVILGEKNELETHKIWISNYNLLKYSDLPEDYSATVKIRYKDCGKMASIEKIDNYLCCSFNDPISAATPGQSAVIYENNELIGGGFIELTPPPSF